MLLFYGGRCVKTVRSSR